MHILVNSVPTNLAEGIFLADLIRQLHLDEKRGIAVAVNSMVISKKIWNEFELKDADQIIIIEAAQGG